MTRLGFQLDRCRYCSYVNANTSQGRPYPAVVLRGWEDESQLEESCNSLAKHVEAWLNDEWTPLGVHKEVADEAAKAYKQVRLEGEADLGAILLGISSSLSSFDFQETFVNAFEVSNKVAELLMLEDNREVCCRSESEQAVYERVEQEISESKIYKQ